MVWIIFLLGAGRRIVLKTLFSRINAALFRKKLFVRTRLPIVPSFRPGKDWFLPQ
jgi:hypothetical protein